MDTDQSTGNNPDSYPDTPIATLIATPIATPIAPPSPPSLPSLLSTDRQDRLRLRRRCPGALPLPPLATPVQCTSSAASCVRCAPPPLTRPYPVPTPSLPSPPALSTRPLHAPSPPALASHLCPSVRPSPLHEMPSCVHEQPSHPPVFPCPRTTPPLPRDTRFPHIEC